MELEKIIIGKMLEDTEILAALKAKFLSAVKKIDITVEDLSGMKKKLLDCLEEEFSESLNDVLEDENVFEPIIAETVRNTKLLITNAFKTAKTPGKKAAPKKAAKKKGVKKKK